MKHMETNTAKNFALQLGALIALYISLSSLLVLLFGIINIAFPDELDTAYAYESAQQSIRFSIAMLIVSFPTYLVLTRLVNKTRRKEGGAYLTLTRWLIYLSLLIGGGVLLGDLVAVINTFLNGEITVRFILKALSVFVVVGAAAYYYALDARGYWNEHEKQSVQYGAVAAAVVVAALIAGFFNIEAPQVVREMRLDEQQVHDLQDIQYRIEDHYRTHDELPAAVADLYAGIPVPEAPEGREPYSYQTTGTSKYELCATFAHPTQRSEGARAVPIEPRAAPLNYNWDHTAGRVCFDRSVEALRDKQESLR